MKTKEIKPQIKSINADVIRLKIETLRKEHGLKAKEMAGIVGMLEQNYSNFINKKKEVKPTLQQMYNIMQYFGVSFEFLIGDSESAKLSGPQAKLSEMEITHLKEKNQMLNDQVEILKDSLDQCKKSHKIK